MSDLEIPAISGIEIRENAPIGKFTSIGVNCTAKALVMVESRDGLGKFLQWAVRRNEPYFIMGGGTNTIFCDEFFDGYVLRLGQAFRDVKICDEMIRAGCSIPLSRLLNISMSENLSGLEFAWDIPGVLGGAIAGNAGTSGESICPLVEAVRGFDAEGVAFAARRDDFEYGYRYCSLKGMVLTEIILGLKKESPDVIQERLQYYKEQRWIQPVGVKSSGCIFKNPEGAHAGKLIDEAGLKGFSIGGAMVSADHANFILNKNKASAEHVLELIEYVREAVRQNSNVELELEVQLIRSPKPVH